MKSCYSVLTKPDGIQKHAKIMQSNVQSNCSDNCAYKYNIMILNIFDPELQRIQVKPMIKNKFRKLLSDMKMLGKFRQY